MNAARAIRRLEQAGFSHEQAAGLADILQEEVVEELPTREFVELVSERDKNSVIGWVVALFFAQLLGQTSLVLIIGNILWGS
jgi:hypothetical protein